MRIEWTKAVMAGVIGTAAMTVVGACVAPWLGMPPVNPAVMLAGAMGGSMVLGWMGHFTIGIVLAVIYAAVTERLPGPVWARGALYGVAPWLLAELVVIPMMGMPLFSSSAVVAMGSLIGHLVYGATVGMAYGLPIRRPARASAA